MHKLPQNNNRLIRFNLFAGMLLAFTVLLLSSCSSTSEESDDLSDATYNLSAEEIYTQANEAMNSGNPNQAIEFFEKLEVKFPYGPFAKQAKLEIIYAYFLYDNLESAIVAAERFIKLFPNHPNVDYAYYMRGVSRYNMEKSFFDELFNQDSTERDPDSARNAFINFNQLIIKFPKSKYNEDAKKRMIFLRNSLAQYEVHVANYYYNRKAYIASVNRAKYILNNYQTTPAIKEALQIMVKAYTKLNLPKLAEDAQRVFDKNYPG